MYLGLDLGTSGMRGLLVDPDGHARASAEASYGVSHLHPGWSEQDPADWIRACESILRQLQASNEAFLQRLQGELYGHLYTPLFTLCR